MKKFFSLLLALCAFNAFALTVDGITFEDKKSVAGKELVLNGVGIRKATFLKIKVYYGALYVTQKTTEANSFLTSQDPKQIVMHFVRDVEVKDLKNTFNEAIEKANGPAHKALLPALDKFNAQLVDMKKNERMIVTFTNDGVVLSVKDKTFEKVPGADFSRGLLNIWFINPLDENLSKGLLGK